MFKHCFTQGSQRRQMSSYSNYVRRLEQLDREAANKFDLDEKQAAILKELNKVNPEGVVCWFESRPMGTQSSIALAEYGKALVKVDRLDESVLIKTLHQGFCIVLSTQKWSLLIGIDIARIK